MNQTDQAGGWASLIHFLRFEYLSVAIVLPFMGAASAASPLSGVRFLAILGGALCFHVYVSILNDLIDLPLDRTNPTRSEYPLVSGRISPAFAWAVVLLMIPLAALFIFWQGGGAAAYWAMASALGMMTIYNVWGKVSPFPPAIDVIQGIGFSSLVLYGAAMNGGLTRLSWLAFALGVIWMVLVNFLGGLRDLASDLAFGVNTTPIFFGVRPTANAQSAPRFTHYYAYSLQGLMILGGLAVIAWNDLHYPAWLKAGLLVLFLLVSSLTFFLLITFFRVIQQNYDRMIQIGLRLLGLSAAALVLPLLPALPLWVTLGVVIAFFLSYRDYSLEPVLAYWRRQ
jgi:4-hydroxybenzoate polyprenyltransferase